MALTGLVVAGVVGLTVIGATASPAGVAAVPPIPGMTAQQLEGLKVYNAVGCSSCHELRDIGGTSGPDLTHAGARWGAEAMRTQIVTPENEEMPAFDGLTAQQLDDLISFLTGLE
jgi:mono/diheme cytochrome c family protein